MIVRDEAHVVRETLDSVAPYIDYWVIVDTGSSDSTIPTIREHMRAAGIPGELHERPWRDFGRNRTEALELSRGKADYIWVLDADDLVVGDLDLSGLQADSYLLRYGENFVYWRRQLFRDGLRWEYRAVVHEYPVCLEPASEERLEGEYHIESRRLGARSRDPRTLERDCALLRAALKDDPNDGRSAFYLAQSYYDMGDFSQALEWYTRRSRMGGWEEEVFFSLLRRGACLMRLDEPLRARAAYLEAWRARPTRAEPLYEIALSYRTSEKFQLGYEFARRAAAIQYPEEETLFLARDVYSWRARDELAICAYYTGRPSESFELWTELLEEDVLPADERERIEGNRDLCVPQLAGARSQYPVDLVRNVVTRVANRDTADGSEVTLTITSCRRLHLFEQTVNSFLQCCSDLDRIGRWICVDNGSSQGDRERMRELYPFFEFIYTDPASERHAASMNRLREAVTSRFWLHLEDDWQFFRRGPYIGRAVRILTDDDRLGQVAFNRNYGETLACRRIVGGLVTRTHAGEAAYRVHEYIEPDTPQWQQHLAGLPAGAPTVAYWPHFTLRPSLMRTEAIRSLGPFDIGEGHFEVEFAKRYLAAGLRTAFFDSINCVHTGRLTSEWGAEGELSAYELVGSGEHPAHRRTVRAPSAIDESLAISVINLDRRPDRWRLFSERMDRAAGREFTARCTRVAAVDGTQLSDGPELRHLFRDNDFGLRRGIVGCALSHISIWKTLARRGQDEIALVLEDDARPCPRFDRQVIAALDAIRTDEPDFDIAFLGYLGTPERGHAGAWLRPMRWEAYIGGAFAYLLSGRGARRLVELVRRDGVQNGIDWFVMFKAKELRALEFDPPLVHTEPAFAGNDVDSDIQHDFAPIQTESRSDSSAGRGVQALRVRMLSHWCAEAELRELWNRMTTDGDYEWRFRGLDETERCLRLVGDDDEDPDHWVVLNAPPPGHESRLDPARTVVFQMEPLMWTERMRERWGRWAAPSPLSFLQVRDHRRYRNSNDWWLGSTYSELTRGTLPQKQGVLSACVSAKYFDPGHVRRVDFLRYLDAQDLDLDIYGAEENRFRHWRGRTPAHDKRRALLPYRYHFAAENHATPNFYTEKIVDCVLAETLCFYWGCPNLDSFIDARAFIRLELEDYEADLARIRDALAADEWSTRLPYIRAEKRRILEEYQFFPTLARVLDPARRSHRWHVGDSDRELVEKLIRGRRCGLFVELSERDGRPEQSETLDPERRLDWSGLCIEADPARARTARALRDCTIADDDGDTELQTIIARNGLEPRAIDWLNLAVAHVDELVGDRGRLDLKRVRANIISMPIAPGPARRRAAKHLVRFGYAPAAFANTADSPAVMVRSSAAQIFGFYHLYTEKGWRGLVTEQVHRWQESGLAHATTRIFASVVGPQSADGAAMLRKTCGDRVELIHVSEDASRAERTILEYARHFCEHDEPLARGCWYMHGKGITATAERRHNVADWRHLMEHFIVERWTECVAALDDHDACGVNWLQEPAPHFSGNFWWARPRYLGSLPARIGPSALDPEMWLGINQPHVRCLHSSGVDHHLQSYGPEAYVGCSPPAADSRLRRQVARRMSGAAHRLAFESFGLAAEVFSDDPELFESVPLALPPGWRARDTAGAGTRFGVMRDGTITRDGTALMHIDGSREMLLSALSSALRDHLALHAPAHVFVHAGVVGVGQAAIVMPGSSRTGKTTLVAELVRAGASYYSDEYAVVGAGGMIHAYPKPLSIRAPGSGHFGISMPVVDSEVGSSPVRARLIVITRYRQDAEWRRLTLAPAQGALALLQHTVAVRAKPREALRAARDLAQTSRVISSPRGEASTVTADLLELVSGILPIRDPESSARALCGHPD
jgi:GR25 family glycosyltransferase involved in LPS biosynthesis/tetratricopeptide (TPR) repeat protein